MAFGQLVQDADQQLRDWIESHNPGIGGRLPSERALARELDLQHYAVNRAMARLVVEGMIERRGYKLYYASPEKRGGPQKFHCDLVINRRSVLMSGYRRVARELGLGLQVHTWQSSEEAVSILDQFRTPECESVVFDPPFGDAMSRWEPATSRLVRQGIPVVCVNYRGTGVSSVTVNRDRALKLLFDHFLELGHEQMALLTLARWATAPSGIPMQWRELCLKNELAGSAERFYLQNDSRFLPEDARRLVACLTGKWRKVTALAVSLNNEYPVQKLLDTLAAAGIEVPGRLSLVSLEDWRPLQTSSPAVTAVAADNALLQETAYLLACRAIRKKREFGILPQPCEVSIQPHLVRRKSSAPNAAVSSRRLRPPMAVPVWEPRSAEFPDHPEELAAIRQRPYDLAAQAAGPRFTPVDLGAHVNRPLNFRRGWLGDLPLRHFPPGRHTLHGIPFDVLGGKSRADSGAVVFQSLTNTTGSARKLPATLRIAINRKAAAIYFLHGCGYVRHLNPFATYTFHAGKRKLGEISLVALGKPAPGLSPKALETEIGKANIQDWWPDYPHYEFPHARVVPLLETEDPGAAHRHVFLYTLEWINPAPRTTVTHLTIQSDVEQPTTLGLLGISVLGARR